MADKNDNGTEQRDYSNDEFTFEYPDAVASDTSDSESVSSEPPVGGRQTGASQFKMFAEKNAVRRNGIIAVLAVLLLSIGYSYLSHRNSPKNIIATPLPIIVQHKPEPQLPPILPPPQVMSTDSSALNQVNDKISAIELRDQNIVSEVDTLNTQVSSVSGSLNAMADKMLMLNRAVEQLSQKVDVQSRVIAKLIAPPMPKKPTLQRVLHLPQYYIQAVIPGRAWLVASNGSSLTVREGTAIAGYGTVNKIDSLDGRVMMSSGKIIRFSQEDS
jgi:intracellular multiplication protein IcmG